MAPKGGPVPARLVPHARRRAHRLPRRGVVLEEGVGELHGHALPVVGVLVLGDSEEHGSRVGGWEGTGGAADPGSAGTPAPRHGQPEDSCFGHANKGQQGSGRLHSPVPSFLECSSSMSGAEAPSASMASAASLSWASSHSTPAATRWMFSTGE